MSNLQDEVELSDLDYSTEIAFLITQEEEEKNNGKN